MTERTRIDPAEIRVGDRVERVHISGDRETIERFTVDGLVAHRAVSSGLLIWDIEAPRVGTAEWFLLDRPDPDKALIERVAEAICNDDHSQETSFGWAMVGVDTKDAYRDNARAALAAIRETHDITPKGGER